MFNIAEKFVSINGEGQRAGQLAVFIRFFGCNLRCAYCDTAWAWEFDQPGERLSAQQIYEYIKQTGVCNVTLTGGEPLLQPDILSLLQILAADRQISVEIETNGSQPLDKVLALPNRPLLTVDYKLPASGMENLMQTAGLTRLDKRDVVKFVCGSQEDLRRAAEVCAQFQLCARTNVYLSPVWGQIQPADMVDFMRANRMNNVSLQLQLHKFIWPPDARGV